jgi:hypothetical protein
MKEDEYILKKLEELGYPWRTTAELGKKADWKNEYYYIWDKNGESIARALLRGTSDEDFQATHETAQLIVDLARYAHTASKAYAKLAHVASDVVMEANINDNDGSTSRVPTATLTKLKGVLFNSELERPYQEGATAVLPDDPN